jgi:hypothetical protein
MPRFRLLTLCGVIAALALIPSSSPAADPKPAQCGDQLAYKDPAADVGGDSVTPLVGVDATSIPGTPSSEILRGFLRYDPAKGAEALTFNMVVKDLKAEVPTGATTLSWVQYYRTPDDTLHFVRAILDFTGAIVYEYGNFTPNPTGVGLTGVSLYEGNTTGKLFEGPEGIVQMVIPADHAPPGTKLTTLYGTTTQGRTLPTSFPPQVSRGTSSVLDVAPDDAPDTAPGTYTVAPCTEAPPATTTTPGTGTAGQQTQSATLPVSLVTKSAKAAKKKSKSKTLSLKLKSTEEITKLGAQLLKGKKVVGTGKLAKLNGTGTLKLKLKSKLKKGSYVLNLVGNRASGERATAAFKLKAK